MSKSVQVISAVNAVTQVERTTYTVHYKFNLGNREVYIDNDVMIRDVGYRVSVTKDGKCKWAGLITNSDMRELDEMIKNKQYEIGQYKFVFETEVERD